MIGLVGKKLGMTRIFSKEGVSIPITVIEVQEHRITQIKNLNNNIYKSIQLTTGIKKSNRLNKPESGHFIKSGVQAGRGLWEFRVFDNIDLKVGAVVNLNLFINIKKVDITGISKGKGFCGTVKRWNFRTQDATHGNSLSHRVPGSIGQNQTPGRVFKGKKMAGHLGNIRVTVQSLEIIRIDTNENLLLIKGSVPGATGSDLIVKPAIKARGI